MPYQAGTAFLAVMPSMRGFQQEVRTRLAAMDLRVPVQLDLSNIDAAAIRSQIGDVDLDVNMRTGQAQVEIEALRARVNGLQEQLRELRETRISVQVDKRPFLDAANAAATFSRNLFTLSKPVIAASLLPALTGASSAVLDLSKVLLLVPGAGLAAAGVLGTVKLGASGVGDVFKALGENDVKKFNEALANVGPEVRELALAAAEVKPAFDAMRLDVQNKLFWDLGDAVRALAYDYLPVAKTGFGGIATSINDVGRDLTAFVLNSRTVEDVATIFENTRSVVYALGPGLEAVLQIVRDIGVVGSNFLPDLARGFSLSAEAAGRFISNARNSGDLARWIHEGIDAVDLLGQTVWNVGATIISVLDAANQGATPFLVTIRNASLEMRNWAASAEGQAAIGAFFEGLRVIAGALWKILVDLGTVFLGFVTQVLPALPAVSQGIVDIHKAAGGVLGVFGELIASVLPVFGSLLSGLAPILGPIAGLIVGIVVVSKVYAGVLFLVRAATIAWHIAQAAFLVIGTAFNLTVAAQTAGLLGWAGAQRILNAAMAANPIGIVITALVALVAVVIWAWNENETFRRIVIAAWEGIKTAASAVWDWMKRMFESFMQAVWNVRDAFVTAWDAIGVAFQWLMTNVVDPVVNAISVGLRAIGDAASWLWGVVVAAFNGIVEAGKFLFTLLMTIILTPMYLFIKFILAPIFTWLYENIVKPSWEGIQSLINAVWTFIRDNIWQPIVDFLNGPMTDTWRGFEAANAAIWQAIQDAINASWTWIRDNIWQPIVDFINNTIVPANRYMQAVAEEVWRRIQEAINASWVWIRDNIWQPIVDFINNTIVPANRYLQAVAAEVWRQIQDNLNSVWSFIRDNIWQPMVDFVTKTIPDAFNTAVNNIRALWDRVKSAVRDPIKAVIDVVYNEGIVKVWNWVAEKVGLDIRLEPYNLPAFAKGGPVLRETIARIGEAGPEYVMSAPAVRNAGGIAAMENMHKRLLSPRETLQAVNSGQVVEGADHNGPGSRTSGFGGVKPHVAQAGWFLKDRFGIGTVGGVGSRPNASDHPSGHALDFMTSGENGTALANFLGSAANWAHFAVKYVIWRQRIMNSAGNWAGMADRGSPTANHMDHVHVSFQGGPGGGAMDGGGGGFSFDPIQWLMDGIGIDLRSITDKLNLGDSPIAQMAVGFGKKTAGMAWDWAVGKATEWWNSVGQFAQNVGTNILGLVGLSGGTVENQVREVARAYGWGEGAQWDAIRWVVGKESGWRPDAQNPTSTASGLFQFIDGTWKAYGGSTPKARMASVHEQARVGMEYFRRRYGSPAGAQAFWQRNGWYDEGGRLDGRGLFWKETLSPERVLSERQNRAFEHLVGTIDRAYGGRSFNVRDDAAFVDAARRGGGDGPLVAGDLIAQVPAGASAGEVVDAALFKLRHTRRGLHDR